MFSHIVLGTNDRQRSNAFYEAIMPTMGWRRRHSATNPELTIWQPPETARPFFILASPFDRNAAAPGNGATTAFMVPERAMVDEVFARALMAGATSEGDPGPRPHYHAHYYGCYFRDLDGHKLCVVCHEPATVAAPSVHREGQN